MSASRSQMAGKAVVASPVRRTAALRAAALQTRAMIREYPDAEFIAECKGAFPDKGIASPDEARVSERAVMTITIISEQSGWKRGSRLDACIQSIPVLAREEGVRRT